MARRARTRLLGTNRWLLTGRLILALFSLLLSGIMAAETEGSEALKWVFHVGAAYLVLDFVYLAVTRWMKDLLLFLTWQLVGDLALACTFLFLTGGVDSPFYYLMLAVVMAAGMVLSWRRGLGFCAAAVGAMWLVTASYVLGFGAPEPSHTRGMAMGEVWVTSLGRSAGLLAVGILTIILNWRLTNVRLVSGKVLENIGEGVLVLDASGTIMYENREFRSLFGIEDLVEGEPVEGVLRENEDAWLLDAIRAGRPLRMERHFRETSGGDVLLRVVVSPLGSKSGVVVRFEDMNVEKRLEEAEREAERYRLAADTACSIAHEVRNPLASLNVAVQELVRGLEPSSDRRELMNVIRYEIGRIDRIVEDFMTLSRIRPPSIRLVAVRGVAEEAQSMLARTEEAIANKAEIILDVPFNLTMRLDADHLRQMLLNLGLNSLQAGARHVTVRATPEGTDGAGVIEVVDDGPGMTKEVLDRIFEPFFTTRTRGSGLGCTVVKKMVEEHGGRVEVQSAPGNGTVFRVYFPGVTPAKEEPDVAEKA